MKNKILSILLIFVLCVTFVPFSSITASASVGITLTGKIASDGSVYAGHSYKLRVLGKSVKFYSNNKKVATVEMTTGKMKVISPGKVTITAKDRKTGKIISVKTFKVLRRATSIYVSPDNIIMEIGETIELDVTKRPSTSTDILKFFSSDKSVATVGVTSGKVTAKAVGKTTIKIYSLETKNTKNLNKDSKTATCTITVVESRNNYQSNVKIGEKDLIGYKCNGCEFTSQDESAMQYHNTALSGLSHGGYQSDVKIGEEDLIGYKCLGSESNPCGFTTDDEAVMQRHIEENQDHFHGGYECYGINYYCTACGIMVDSNLCPNAMFTDNPESHVINVSYSEYRCNGCDFTTQDEETMFIHQAENTIEAHVGYQSDVKIGTIDVMGYKCNGCDYTATEEADMQAHQAASKVPGHGGYHFGVKIGTEDVIGYKCNSCDFTAESEDKMKEHQNDEMVHGVADDSSMQNSEQRDDNDTGNIDKETHTDSTDVNVNGYVGESNGGQVKFNASSSVAILGKVSDGENAVLDVSGLGASSVVLNVENNEFPNLSGSDGTMNIQYSNGLSATLDGAALSSAFGQTESVAGSVCIDMRPLQTRDIPTLSTEITGYNPVLAAFEVNVSNPSSDESDITDITLNGSMTYSVTLSLENVLAMTGGEELTSNNVRAIRLSDRNSSANFNADAQNAARRSTIKDNGDGTVTVNIYSDSNSVYVLLYESESNKKKPDVDISATSDNTIRLEWDKIEGAEKYGVYRIVNGKAKKLWEGKKCALNIKGLKSETEYQFIVRAYIDDKWTSMNTSDIVAAKTK